MEVINKIQDELYEKIIDYAYQKCDAVMFVSNKVGFNDKTILLLDINMERIKVKLQNSLLKSRNGGQWVFTGALRKKIGDSDDLCEVLFYKLNEDVKEYLLTNKDLYAWLNPDYPEDMAFFKEGYCWLYSVTHEKMCTIYYETDGEYEELVELGIEFRKKIILPKEKRYYEEY